MDETIENIQKLIEQSNNYYIDNQLDKAAACAEKAYSLLVYR